METQGKRVLYAPGKGNPQSAVELNTRINKDSKERESLIRFTNGDGEHWVLSKHVYPV